MTNPLAKSLAEAVRSTVSSALLDVHTAQPGRIKSYDRSTQTCEVQPLLQRVLPARDEEDEDVTEDPPILVSVPVVWPRVGSYYLHMPLSEGDLVLLVFSEGDTNGPRQSGQLSRPSTVRRHSMSGAVALPGYFQRSDAISPGANLELGHTNGTLLEITDTLVKCGGALALAEYPNLNVHLSAIAAALDALVTAVTSGGTTAQPNYGVAAKTALDSASPIGTDVTRGT